MQSQSTNIALIKIISTPISNREYYSSSKILFNLQNIKICPLNKAIYKYQCKISKTKQNTFVNLIKHKREYTIIPIIPMRGYFYI